MMTSYVLQTSLFRGGPWNNQRACTTLAGVARERKRLLQDHHFVRTVEITESVLSVHGRDGEVRGRVKGKKP